MSMDKDTTDRVLATLNKDGSRRWLKPKLAKGLFYKYRLVVAWTLMFVFVLLPHLRWGGKPLFLLDLPARKFVLFGTTFLPTDTLLLLFAALSLFFGIFIFTALFGRVWCGWACPQTVYMEFLYRPVERFFEGKKGKKSDGSKILRQILKYITFLLLSMFLTHAFLSYFVGPAKLWGWMLHSPFDHLTTFFIMLGMSGGLFFNFSYFREQTCLVACPYGRFQSVLLDKQSLIVGYDYNRGDPKGRKADRRKNAEKDFGDCIDCNACVTTCPTGIDIRDGLQMECINCTQCMDACDTIMDRIKKPRGLIRYSSQNRLEGKEQGSLLRPRLIIYPLLLLLMVSLLGFFVYRRTPIHTVLLRSAQPYRLMPDDQIANLFRLKVTNRHGKVQKVWLSLAKGQKMKLIVPQNPLRVGAYKASSATFFVIFSRELLRKKKRQKVLLKIKTSRGYKAELGFSLVGPINNKKSIKK